MSGDGPTDDIVGRARAGDPSAWRRLHDDVAGRLVLWLTTTRMTGGADPEDVASEAWLTAARRIHDFRGDEDDFAGWLFGIARLVAANERRRAERQPATPVADVADGDPGRDAAPDPAADVTARDRTRRLLATLPQREAEVVACRDVVGLDVAATARALGISRPAVRVAHHRGLGRLRSVLAEEESQDP